jgi:hypothetical protein
LVVRRDAVLGLDFAVHAGVYGKVPFLPQGLVVVVVVLHHQIPSQYLGEEHMLIDTRKYDRQIVLPVPSHSAGPASPNCPCTAEPYEYTSVRVYKPANSNLNAA